MLYIILILFSFFLSVIPNLNAAQDQVTEASPLRKFKKTEKKYSESEVADHKDAASGFCAVDLEANFSDDTTIIMDNVFDSQESILRVRSRNNLYRNYISFLHKYPLEYQEAIILIFNAAKQKRILSKKITRDYGIAQEDPIQEVLTDMTVHFQAEAVIAYDQMNQDGFRTSSCKKKRSKKKEKDAIAHSAELMRDVTKEVVQQEMKKEKEDSFDEEDIQAIEDTATLLGTFLATQATTGMSASPQELIGFLSSINFIAAAPAVVHLCADICNCSPVVEKRFVIAATVLAVLVTIGLQGLNIAVSFGAFE